MSEFQIAFNSPIYCACEIKAPSFLKREETIGAETLIAVCCGGGSAKSGITNSIKIGNLQRRSDNILEFNSIADHDLRSRMVTQIVCASNGRFLFGCAEKGTAVYRITKGKDECNLVLEEVLYLDTVKNNKKCDGQNVITVLNDDRTILTGGDDGCLYKWLFEQEKNTFQLRLLGTSHVFEESIAALSVHPSQSYCFVGSSKGNVAVVDMKSFEIPQRFASPYRSSVSNILFPSSTRCLIVYTGRETSEVYAFALESEKSSSKWSFYKTVYSCKGSISRVKYLNELALIAISNNEGDIGLFQYPSFGKYITMHSAHNLPVTSICYIPPTDRLLSVQDVQGREKSDPSNEGSRISPSGQGWIVSSSVDYTMTLLKVKKTAVAFNGVGAVYVLVLLLLLAFALYITMKRSIVCCEDSKLDI